MSETKKMKLTFAGGAGWVTGANFLFETCPPSGEKSFKMLIDCGLIQGEQIAEYENWEPFIYNPKEIDVLFVTHAHEDHIGRIPKLIYEGFNGKIIATPATKDLTMVMLQDTVKILGGSRRGVKFDLQKIYSQKTLEKISGMWETHEYGQNFKVNDLDICFKDAGHILGSAMIEMKYNNSKIVFTGDLGNSPSPLLNDTENISDARYLVMESVYGDRNHEQRSEREENLKKIILEAYDKKSVLLVPIFSLERTQEFLYELNNFVESKQIPPIKIYLDTPLGINITEIYKKYTNLFKKTVKVQIKQGDNIFDFPGLTETERTEDSKAILHSPNPKIIMAGSGMSQGGRILHHEKNYLGDPKTILLLTGYQTPGTLGRLLEEGRREVVIFDERVKVRAKVFKINGYSGHKDSFHLMKFVENTKDSLEKAFLVMGEPSSSMFLAQKLRDNLGVNAIVPETDDSVFLDF